MTLPVSGAISFNAINVELGVAGTTQASLNQASYRTLAGVPSGQISLSNFYGKANQFSFAISSNQTNANLRTLAVNAGWNQSSKVIATINNGIYISSNGTGTPALTVNGSFPNGVELVNNGFIIGMGGAGGRGGSSTSYGNANNGFPGAAGGLALQVSVALTLTNNSTIGGGGGGGGGGAVASDPCFGIYGGGGGGGGGRSSLTNSAGGPAGDLNGAFGVAGGAGTNAAAGTGGLGNGSNTNARGGAGGGWGATGSTGSKSPFFGPTGGVGGAGGGAISGNSNITYLATGTRLGAIT